MQYFILKCHCTDDFSRQVARCFLATAKQTDREYRTDDFSRRREHRRLKSSVQFIQNWLQ